MHDFNRKFKNNNNNICTINSTYYSTSLYFKYKSTMYLVVHHIQIVYLLIRRKEKTEHRTIKSDSTLAMQRIYATDVLNVKDHDAYCMVVRTNYHKNIYFRQPYLVFLSIFISACIVYSFIGLSDSKFAVKSNRFSCILLLFIHSHQKNTQDIRNN